MIKAINKKRVVSLAVFAIGILMVLYYMAVKQRVEFDSDFTDTLLWAEAMLTGNGLFDVNMNYAYTLPFGGSLLMAPFVAVFGVGYKAHVMGFIVFLAIFVFALYKLFKAMDFSVDASLVCTGLVLFLTLPTKDTRMTIWGHVIHYSLGVLFIVIALDIYHKIDIDVFDFGKRVKFLNIENSGSSDEEKKSGIKYLVILAVLTALFCTNGLSSVLFFALPFFGAVFLERFIEIKDSILCKKNINTVAVLIICAASGMFGFVLSKLLQRNVKTVYDSMFKDIQTWQNWVWDFEGRIRSILVLCMGELNDEAAMESFTGIRLLYMALFGFIVIVVPVITLVTYKQFKNKTMRLLVIAYFVLTLASFFIFEFSDAKGTAHRIIGTYLTAVILIVAYMAWLIKNKELCRFGVVLAFALSGAALLSTYSMASLSGENRFDKLARVLQDNDLKYGYAEYWSAQVTTVLSESKVEVCPVNFSEEGTVVPQMYNIRTQQFDDKEGVDRYFLFTSAWEYSVTKDTVGADAIDVIQFDDDGYIMVFDHNIF